MKTNTNTANNRKEVKKMRKIGLIALMTVFLAGMVYGACVFTTPAASGTLTGAAQNINITEIDISDPSIQNCTVSGSSALTGSSFGPFAALNNSGIDNETNVTIDTTSLTDANDWILTATCYNESGTTETCTSRTGITVDNTNPICTASEASDTSYPPTQTFTVTCTNATSATVQFGTNAPKDMTEASDVCTYAGSQSEVPEGIYEVTFITSDGTDSTICSLQNVRIDVDSTLKQMGVAAAASAAAKKGAGAQNNKLVVLVLVVGVGIWYMRKKK